MQNKQMFMKGSYRSINMAQYMPSKYLAPHVFLTKKKVLIIIVLYGNFSYY